MVTVDMTRSCDQDFIS